MTIMTANAIATQQRTYKKAMRNNRKEKYEKNMEKLREATTAQNGGENLFSRFAAGIGTWS